MKQIIIPGALIALAVLAACGGANKMSDVRRSSPLYAPTANGPLKSACLGSGRKARSSQLCGCIQAVADVRLSRSDQRRAVGFYNDPQSAQDIRQSDRASDERFWDTYSNYAKEAARICR